MRRLIWTFLLISILALVTLLILTGEPVEEILAEVPSGNEGNAVAQNEDGLEQAAPSQTEMKNVTEDKPDDILPERKASAVIQDESKLGPAVFPQATLRSIEREYAWNYGGKQWTYRLRVPQEVYEYYSNRERLPLVNYGVFSIYVTDPGHKEFISALADNFSEAAARERYSLKQTVEFVLAFVQSLKYVTDDVSKGLEQYTRYPLETLVEQEGDCKDKSILFASILREMGISAVLVILPGDPGHVAVGIKGEGLPGTYYEYQGARYYYVETTASGWQIGQIPDELRNREAIIVPLKPKPLILHEWESKVTASGHIKLVVTVRNLGTASARDTGVYAALDAGDGKVYDQRWSEPLDLKPGSKGIYTLYLKVPSGVRTRLLVKIVSDGYRVDESASSWFLT